MRTKLTIAGIVFLSIAFSACDQPITSPSSDTEFPADVQRDASSHEIHVTTEIADAEASSQNTASTNASYSEETTVASPFASDFELSGSLSREGSNGDASFDPNGATYNGDEYVEDPQAHLYSNLPYDAQYTGSQVTFHTSDGGSKTLPLDSDLQTFAEQITIAERETYSGGGRETIRPVAATAKAGSEKKKPKKKDVLAYFRDQGYEVRKLHGPLYEVIEPMSSPLGSAHIEKQSILNTKTMEVESATIYHGGKKKMKHVYKKGKNGKASHVRTTIYQPKGKPIVVGRKLGRKKKNHKK